MNAAWRADARFSLCGLNCCLCLMYEGGYCPGCGNGNHTCALQRCAQARGGVEYCFLCPAYPCAIVPGGGEADSVSFITARALGTRAYLDELDEKARLFKRLLEHYNDGRRKSLFMRAANLLTLEELRAAVARLPDPATAPVRQRAAVAAAVLAQIARERGLELGRRASSAHSEENL